MPRFLSLVLVIGLLLAGCTGDPTGDDDVRPSADESTRGVQGCAPSQASGPAGTSCSFALAPGDGTFLFVEWRIEAETRFRVTDDHRAVWRDATAYFFHRVVGESENGEGLTGLRIHTAADTPCLRDEACPGPPHAEERSTEYTFTLPAGRHFLLYTFFGAQETSLEVQIEADALLSALDVQRGDTDLLLVPLSHASSDGEHEGTARIQLPEPAWLVVRHAGDVRLASVSFSREDGTRAFTALAAHPAFQAPASWGDGVIVDHANLAVPAGTAEVQARWAASATESGHIVIGVAHAPRFLDPFGGIENYGAAG